MAQTPIVLLHGWGGNSRCWSTVQPQLAEFGPVTALDLPGYGAEPMLANRSLDSYLDWLAARLPARALLVGFSLGGMLALALAARRPGLLAGVVTVASNLSFIARPEWPTALPAATLASFVDNYRIAPAATIARFSALASGGQRAVKKQLAAVPPLPPAVDAGADQLDLLGELCLVAAAGQMAATGLPVAMLFGDDDKLVPVAAAERIATQFPHITCKRCIGSHFLPLSAPAEVVALVEQLLGSAGLRPQLDKRAVARSFSRAAPGYAAAATLQAGIAEQLLADSSARQPRRVVDIGTASGVQLAALGRRFGGAELVGLDIAEGMLKQAARAATADIGLICADAEALPLADRSVEVAFSSFALQWCEQLEQLAAELARVVTTGGELLLAVPVAGTLAELRAAWAAVDEGIHINQFASPQRWCSALAAAGFAVDQLAVHDYSEHHSSVRALLQSIKAVGAHNTHRERSRNLTGRQRIAALYDNYPTAADGSCQASWKVLRGRAVRLPSPQLTEECR